MSIYTKLFNIQKQNILLTADAKNPFYNSKYISIENIMATLKPLLEKEWLLLFHSVENTVVKTSVYDTETETEVSSFFPINATLDAQKKGAEITYGKRYNLVALFCIVEDDDDGNFASWKTAPQSVQNTPSATNTPKAPFKPYTAPAGKSPDATSWMTEKQVDVLFDKMISGHEPLATNVTNLIWWLRKSGTGISKKLAGYIEDQWMKRVENIAFPWPVVTKDGVEVPFN